MPAKRAYGMDQEFYPWSPIVSRPVLRWPDNARVALAVIVNLEHWDWEVPAGTPVAVSPMGGPEGLWSGNQPQFPDIGGYGNHEYGNRVGIFRILAVLDKYGITPTLALDKAVADHYPIAGRGGPEARRRVHRARPVAPPHHPYRHVGGRGAAIHPRLDRGGRKGHRHAPGRLVRPRFPGDAEHPQPARRRRHPLRLRLGQRRAALQDDAEDRRTLFARRAAVSRRQLHPPARPAHDQRGQPAVARVVRRALRRRRHHRAADGAAPASLDHGPALAHPAPRRGARPYLRPARACGRPPAARSSTGSRRSSA